jgi:hypothetical protein
MNEVDKPKSDYKPKISPMSDNESRHYDIGAFSRADDIAVYRRLAALAIGCIFVGIGLVIADEIHRAFFSKIYSCTLITH